MSWNIRYTTVRPISPMPTTLTPMTAPELKAILSAAFNPRCACTVVRVFARTAMLMPMNPARPEPIAPTRYEMAVPGIAFDSPTLPRTSASMNTHSTMKTMTTNTASSRYSRDRNAMAPSRIALPMKRTCSLPSSACVTLHAKIAANISATTPAAIAKYIISTGCLHESAAHFNPVDGGGGCD